MQLKNNIPEIIERLERVKAALGGGGSIPPAIPDFSDAMFSALNTGNGLMKRRIFNLGLDAEGNPLGNYEGSKTRVTSKKLSINTDDDVKKRRGAIGRRIKASPDSKYTEYEKIRLSHGRQIEHKDLQLTGALFSSIETVKSDNRKVVIAITNPETALIAGYQEEQIGKIRGTGQVPIFIPSQAEYEQMQVEGSRLIKEVIHNLLQ
jgi:hypothetical protein